MSREACIEKVTEFLEKEDYNLFGRIDSVRSMAEDIVDIVVKNSTMFTETDENLKIEAKLQNLTIGQTYDLPTWSYFLRVPGGVIFKLSKSEETICFIPFTIKC
jgi:hypothetical protein